MPTNRNDAEFADTYGVTNERMKHIAKMARRVTEIAIQYPQTILFRVYAPAEYLAAPINDRESCIYERMKNTTWRVRWPDDNYDQLTFVEFLEFNLKYKKVGELLAEAMGLSSGPRLSGNADASIPLPPPDMTPHLTEDKTIKAIFRLVMVQPTVRPTDAVN